MSDLAQRFWSLSKEQRALLELKVPKEKIRKQFLSIPRSSRVAGESTPLSFAQERLWFLHQLAPEGFSYNTYLAVRLNGELEADLLRLSFQEIVRRHEVLRTCFVMKDGHPAQMISPSVNIPFQIVDLQNQAEAEREELARSLAVAEAQKPFNLEQAPVIRVTVFRLRPEEHLMLAVVHHIASDRWSVGVLMQEIALHYEGLKRSNGLLLPELPIQYADYAQWQRRLAASGALEEPLAFWMKQLSGQLEPAELPFDYPRGTMANARGKRCFLSISPAVLKRLVELSQKTSATLFMSFLASFEALLYRYTGQENIVIGCPIAVRPQSTIQQLIGCFLNTLPFRTDVNGNPDFLELIQRVRQRCLAAYSHQDAPYEQMVAGVQPERAPGQVSLFQVMFTLNDLHDPSQSKTALSNVLELSNMTLEVVDLDIGALQCDLALHVERTQNGANARIEFDGHRFDSITIERMLRNWHYMLEEMTGNPAQSIRTIPLMEEHEKLQLLNWGGNCDKRKEAFRSIDALVQEQAQENPNAIALSDAQQQITFQQLDRRANQLARYLLRMKVRQEMVLAVCLEPSVDMVVTLLAILKAGGAYLPMDLDYPRERLTFMLKDSHVVLLITRKSLNMEFPETPVLHLDCETEKVAAETDTPFESANKAQSLAYVIYTSGSTGRPKGVAVSHQGLMNLVNWHVKEYEVTPRDRASKIASLAFDASVWELWPYLGAGASVHFPAPGTIHVPSQLVEWLAAQEITLGFLPTPLAETALQEKWPNQGGNLRALLTGGDKLHCVNKSSVNFKLYNHYGPTENSVVATWTEVAFAEDGARVVPPIGRPLPNTQVYVLDASMQLMPVGATGELYIGGTSLARGYLYQPRLTAERFVPNPFSGKAGERLYKTGDLVRYQNDGNLQFIGRIDHQVKIRGFRIELGEIEAVLMQHPAVQQGAVIAQRNPTQHLAAYVVLQQGKDVSSRELRSYLMEKLPHYMVPGTLVVLQKFPLTPNGKIDKQALALIKTTETTKGYAPPKTATEEQLAGIWAEVLQVEQVGTADDFFELGGHSLLATQLLSRVQSSFGTQIPLRRFFENATIAGLAEEIGHGLQDGTHSALPAIPRRAKGLDIPLSFAQQRLWFLNEMEPGSVAYNIPAEVRLQGKLKVEALCGSLEQIVRRHEVLRTRFEIAGEQPCQIIEENVPIELAPLDLTSLAEEAREKTLDDLRTQEASTPFDLRRGPVFRTKLIKCGEEDFVLLFTMHHIASDGWSLSVLMHDLKTFYASYANGEVTAKAELPIQYADYAVWLRQWLRGDVLERQLDYWRKQLTAPALELPTDFPRAAVQSLEGGRYRFQLDPGLTKRLKDLGQRKGATLFMVLLGSFQVLLSRYTGQREIKVGTPIANRNRQELEGLIGFFVNTLVLQTRIEPTDSFLAVLDQVREVTLGAYAHQDVPFEKLVEELEPERDLSRSPLFQVMLALQNMPRTAAEMPDLQLSMANIDTSTSKFDLSLFVSEEANGLDIWVEYSLQLFRRSTIVRLCQSWEEILLSVAVDPDKRVWELPVLTPWKQLLLAQWNNNGRRYPSYLCVHELVEGQASLTPEAIAVAYEHQTITYAELNSRANKIAHYLRDRGVGADSTVGICMERSLDLIVGVLGILKAGGAYVPLDPAYPEDRLRFMTTDAGARIILTKRELLSAIPAGEIETVCIDHDWSRINLCSSNNPPLITCPDNLAYVIYTSGSTGQPKGVMMGHGALCNLLQWQEYHGVNRGKTLQFASLSFDVSFQEIFSTLIAGDTLILVSDERRRDPEFLQSLIMEHGVECLFMPFLALHTLAESATERGVTLSSLKEVVTAGERLQITPAIAKFFAGLPRTALHNHYGPSETHVVTALRLQNNREEWSAYPTIGKPIDNTEIHILDEFMQQRPIGVVGEIYIGGVALARGYLNRAKLTAERFVPDHLGHPGSRLYRTGDLGRYMEDGAIEFLGRKDHQVKILGYRIELGEVESSLMQHPAVEKAAVDVLEDGAGQKQLIAYVVMRLGMESLSGTLEHALRQKLPNYMVPAQFVVIPDIPVSPNGKTDRQKLKRLASLPKLKIEITPPRNSVEEMISEIWSELLKRTEIGIHQNFFRVGGHSLLATRLASRIRTVWNIEMPVRTIFEAPTIAELAEVIARLSINGTRENIPAIEKVARDQALPLSFPQQRLWFLEQLNPEANNYLIPSVLRLKGPLNSPALRSSLNKVIQRHEALRTTFTVSEGKPVQVVHAHMETPLQEINLESIPDKDRQIKLRELIEKESSAKFDFVHGPLLKACLVRLDAQEHLLILVLHHIITDGWSMGILMKELVAFYEQDIRGDSRQLDALKIQYADYAAWQHRWLKGTELDRQLSYWTKKLAGAPGLLALPTDKPRPAIQNRAGAICHLEFDAELTSGLHQLAWKNGATLFMVLIAGFNVLLSRYSGQEDVVIGTPIAGRNHQELEELIGLFVNTLALRTNVLPEARFIDLLAQVKACTLEAYAHPALPFEKVVEELAIERTMAHTPVFQVLFALQNVPEAGIAMEWMEITQEQVESRTAKFDVTLALRENKGRLVGDLEYRTDLFEPATISQLAKHFENLLRSAVANPEQHVEELQFLYPDERRLLLTGHNGTEKKWVSSMLPTEMICRRAMQNPDSIALIFRNNIWTYRQLHEETNRLANNLKARGVGHGSIVGVCMERSARQVLALLAVMKSGAAYVPLDPTYPAERLRYMIEHAAARIVIVDESTQPLVSDREAVQFMDLTSGSAEDVDDGPREHDLAYVIYTSGSTGQPKGVMIRHANLKNLVEWQCARVGITAQDRGTYVSGLGFDAATLELWPYLAAGASVAIPEEEVRTDPERLQEWLTDLEATISFAPTPMAEYLLARDWPESSRLRALHTGGDRLTRRPRSSFKFKLINNYGPTETTVIATSTFVAPDGEMQPSIGLPIANTTVYILDSRLQPVPRGVIGKLYAGGEGVALGYLGRPALTAERFIPDLYGKPGKRLYDTGDLARQRSDGDLEFIARADQQVKLRGFRIELGEIESLLRNHATLLDAAVILWESGNDKRLVAFVVTKPGERADQETLRRYLEARLPAYMVPSIFMFVEALPVTSNGKIDRRALPTPIIASAGGRELVAPRDSIEEGLAHIWKGLLQTNAISVTDNFFLVGGHSLLAIELMYKIQKEFNRKLPISTLFKSGTIEDLAGLLRSQQDMTSRSILVEISSGTGKQPFFCVHGAGGQVFRYKELANYLGKELPFIGLEAPSENTSEDSYQCVEEMAAQYLTAIREVQAEGPYYLGGWSFGGVVAFEIAQQLTRQGEEVALLTMFDTTAPGTESKLLSDQEIKEVLIRDFSLHATSDGNDALRSMLERAKADSVVPPSFELPDAQRFLSLFSQHMKAAQNYHPDPWKGKIILFEARERLPKQVADASLGWAMLSQSVDRYVIAGNHYSMLRTPNVKSLAEQLKQHLECAPMEARR